MFSSKRLFFHITKIVIRESTKRSFFRSTKLQTITFAGPIKGGNSLKVELSDGRVYEFPSLFLQDNCTCPSCFHPSSFSRSRKMTELNLESFLQKVEFDSEKVKCIWSDGHEGTFPEAWLEDRRFTNDNFKKRTAVLRDRPLLFNSSHRIYQEDFQKVISNSAALLKVLQTLSVEGVALITNSPTEVGQVRKLANAIGYIRPTHYGYEFTVKSEKNAVNLAYTNSTLCVHTDLPYYLSPPGVQALHCIKQFQGDGGKSLIVDGFLVAEEMRKKYPNQYKALCQIPVEFYDFGQDYIQFHKIHHSPTFVVNPKTSQLTRIVYSNQQLSSYQPVPLENVDELYKALKLFTDLCYNPENMMRFKLNDGDILIFDNWRILHGREGFDPSKGERHLEGCYIDWDEIFSRIRVIEGSLNNKVN